MSTRIFLGVKTAGA